MTNLLLAIAPKCEDGIRQARVPPRRVARRCTVCSPSASNPERRSPARCVGGCAARHWRGEEGGTRTGRGVMASRYQTQKDMTLNIYVTIQSIYSRMPAHWLGSSLQPLAAHSISTTRSPPFISAGAPHAVAVPSHTRTRVELHRRMSGSLRCCMRTRRRTGPRLLARGQ